MSYFPILPELDKKNENTEWLYATSSQKITDNIIYLKSYEYKYVSVWMFIVLSNIKYWTD